MADLRNLKHDQNTTRDTLAFEVRDDINGGTGANVVMNFYEEGEDAQATIILGINLGTAPFGTAAITNQAFTYTGTATGTKATSNTGTVQSFAIMNRDGTKILRGSAGSTTATGTYDVEIAGGAAIKENEKIKLTSFTYTASL